MQSQTELIRCTWLDLSKDDYVAYHDLEWGLPVHDDRVLFEFIILEGAQAGLSWYTVLRKRESYREAFDGFDPEIIGRYDEAKITELLSNPGIIRNKQKVHAAIGNARGFLEVRKVFRSFDSYLWSFVGGKPKLNSFKNHSDIPATTPESDAMSKDLRQQGFKFVGSTICYALMQGTGMVNDHTTDCFRRQEIIDSY